MEPLRHLMALALAMSALLAGCTGAPQSLAPGDPEDSSPEGAAGWPARRPETGTKAKGFAFEATNSGSADAPGTATINGSQALSFTATPGATQRHAMTPAGNAFRFKADFPRSPEHGGTVSLTLDVDLGRCEGMTVSRFFVNATATSIGVASRPDRCEL